MTDGNLTVTATFSHGGAAHLTDSDIITRLKCVDVLYFCLKSRLIDMKQSEQDAKKATGFS